MLEHRRGTLRDVVEILKSHNPSEVDEIIVSISELEGFTEYDGYVRQDFDWKWDEVGDCYTQEVYFGDDTYVYIDSEEPNLEEVFRVAYWSVDEDNEDMHVKVGERCGND